MSYFFNLITLKTDYWFGARVRQANGNDPLQKKQAVRHDSEVRHTAHFGCCVCVAIFILATGYVGTI